MLASQCSEDLDSSIRVMVAAAPTELVFSKREEESREALGAPRRFEFLDNNYN